MAKTDPIKEGKIAEMIQSNHSSREIAKILQCSLSTINKVKKNLGKIQNEIDTDYSQNKHEKTIGELVQDDLLSAAENDTDDDTDDDTDYSQNKHEKTIGELVQDDLLSAAEDDTDTDTRIDTDTDTHSNIPNFIKIILKSVLQSSFSQSKKGKWTTKEAQVKALAEFFNISLP